MKEPTPEQLGTYQLLCVDAAIAKAHADELANDRDKMHAEIFGEPRDLWPVSSGRVPA